MSSGSNSNLPSLATESSSTPSTLINVNSFKFVVIIPSAGSSERFQHHSSSSASPSKTNGYSSSTSSSSTFSNPKSLPKQYSTICNKPLIYHTVSAFSRLKWIDHIVVIASTGSIEKMESILLPLFRQQTNRFVCIPGGATRHRSIQKGIEFVRERSLLPDIVIVHDGARPFIEAETLHQLVTNCHRFGAAGVICKLTSTILSTKTDPETLSPMLDRALNRSEYFASEMPQAFKYELLVDAYDKCSIDDLDHNTECLDLIQKYSGIDAKLMEIDPSIYFKVTYRKDLYAADQVLKERRVILLHCDFIDKKQRVDYKFIKYLKDDLCSNFASVKYFNNSKEIAQSNHSSGTVHILLHYCDQLSTVMEQNLANYDNLIYTVLGSEPLPESSYPQIIHWSNVVKTKHIKNFYLIFIHVKNLDQESLRLRNVIVYLSKELPGELSGQCFFM